MVNQVFDRTLTPVLVVEGDSALRTLFTALLTHHGYRVDCVADGAEALPRIERTPYRVLILDLGTAATGAGALRRIAETEPSLLQRTIVTTSMSPRDLARIDCSNAFAVVRKPFDIDDLLMKVHECASRGQSRRPRQPRMSSSQADDDREGHLDRSMLRFASALPILKETFRSSPLSDGEAFLRSELRRVAGELAQVLAQAASSSAGSDRARRYAALGNRALRIAGAEPSMPGERCH